MKRLFPLLLAAVFLTQSAFARQAPPLRVTITDADEIAAGKVLSQKFEQEEGMRPTPQTDRFNAFLQKIADRLSVHAKRKIPYTMHFDPDPTFRSAVGLPGGQVYIGAGILAYIDTEDQLAAVIGHEIEHIDLDQCRQRLAKVMQENNISMTDLHKLKIDPFLPGYGYDGEMAADAEGVKLAMASGFSPTGAIRLLQTYVILGQQMTHTQNEAEKKLKARIAQIEGIAATDPASAARKETPFKFPD